MPVNKAYEHNEDVLTAYNALQSYSNSSDHRASSAAVQQRMEIARALVAAIETEPYPNKILIMISNYERTHDKAFKSKKSNPNTTFKSIVDNLQNALSQIIRNRAAPPSQIPSATSPIIGTYGSVTQYGAASDAAHPANTASPAAQPGAGGTPSGDGSSESEFVYQIPDTYGVLTMKPDGTPDNPGFGNTGSEPTDENVGVTSDYANSPLQYQGARLGRGPDGGPSQAGKFGNTQARVTVETEVGILLSRMVVIKPITDNISIIKDYKETRDIKSITANPQALVSQIDAALPAISGNLRAVTLLEQLKIKLEALKPAHTPEEKPRW